MTFNEFKSSLKNGSPPKDINNLLTALWYDAKGEWNKAHKIAQEISDTNGAWVHAYLHRKEGDRGNSGYWYSRAEKQFSNTSLDEEWEVIVKTFLEE